METLTQLFSQALTQVVTSFSHNWPYLLVSIVISVLLKLYLDPQKVSAFLARNSKAGVIGATAAAVGTPLCSCGTTAVILGMMASMMPWAPIVAFMVASPLSSPEGLIYSAGLFGWPFAIMYFVASIFLGLAGGAAAALLERRGWLANQTRFTAPAVHINLPPARAETPQAVERTNPAARFMLRPDLTLAVETGFNRIPSGASSSSATPELAAAPSCGCGSPAGIEPAQPTAPACGCGSAPAIEPVQPVAAACGCGSSANAAAEPVQTQQKPRPSLRIFLKEAFSMGKMLVLMFFGFAFIGYFLNGLIPDAWVSALFGQGSIYSVPLAALLGVPLYINSEGSLPLVRALIDGGMSQGAAMAFLITGSGTSIGAVTGMLTIARWRVVALIIAVLWIGAVIMGTLFNLLLAGHLI